MLVVKDNYKDRLYIKNKTVQENVF